MNTSDFLNSLCFGDLQRFNNVLTSYIALEDYPSIMENWVGYNSNSWYAYIALENWVTIWEAFNWIEYIVSNYENWDEFLFDEYKEALGFSEWLNTWENATKTESKKYKKALWY